MPGGASRDSLGWLGSAPTFLGVETGENLNTKETHVGMNGDVTLDRSSTLLTSSKNQVKPVSLVSNPGGRVFLFPLVTAGFGGYWHAGK